MRHLVNKYLQILTLPLPKPIKYHFWEANISYRLSEAEFIHFSNITPQKYNIIFGNNSVITHDSLRMI